LHFNEKNTNNGEILIVSYIIIKRQIPMKKQILSFALVAAIIGSIAAGCGSSKDASSADSTGTRKDTTTTKMSTDTMKKDTSMKKDTTHH